jgi:hypothetical protein
LADNSKNPVGEEKQILIFSCTIPRCGSETKGEKFFKKSHDVAITLIGQRDFV